MLLVGLTGGIGAGKSTVARMLGERGAVVIDADDLARRAVAPGSPGLARVVEAFGENIVGDDGSLDRRRLADIVFADADRRADLEAIVLPDVARAFAEAVRAYRGTDRIVVYDVPLLAERGMQDMFDLVVVVVAGEDRRAERLRRDRDMTPDEIRARDATQMTDRERVPVADVLLDNDGEPEELAPQVDRLWEQLTDLVAAGR